MNYFEQKAEEINHELYTNGYNQKQQLETKIIELGLKEVARDIRHQLCDAILLAEDFTPNAVQNIIMNFEPRIKQIDNSKSKDTVMVQVMLREIVKHDTLCDLLGINCYCVAEGANGDEYISVPINAVKECGLI